MQSSSAAAFGPPAEALKESSKRTKNRRFSLQVPAAVRNAWIEFRRKNHSPGPSSNGVSTGSLFDLRYRSTYDYESQAPRQRPMNSRNSSALMASPQRASSQEDLDRHFENFETFLPWEPTSASGGDVSTSSQNSFQPMPRQRSKSDPRKYFGLRRRSPLGNSTGDLSYGVPCVPPSLEQLPEGVQVHHATPVVPLEISPRRSTEELRFRSSSFSSNPRPALDSLPAEVEIGMRFRSVSLSSDAAKNEKKNLKKSRKISLPSFFGQGNKDLIRLCGFRIEY